MTKKSMKDWKGELLRDLSPWRRPKLTDIGIARKYHIRIEDAARLRKRVKAQLMWQTGHGPPPTDDFFPVLLPRPTRRRPRR